MSESSGKQRPAVKPGREFRAMERLLRARATTGVRNRHFWIILGLLAVFSYLYYGVLTAYHDVYVVVFFYPLIYAAIVFRVRGVIISGLALLAIILPYALFSSQDPYSLSRTLLFALFAFLISGLGATLLNFLEHQLEAYREIVALNEELNQYIERLQSTQKQLIQAEKMNAIGQLSAGVAHELNNPLAGVLVYTKLLMKRLGSDSFDRAEALNNLAKMEAAVTHSSTLIRGLLDFARQSDPVLKPVAVGAVVDQVMALVGHQAQMKRIKVVREEAPDLPPVMADFGQLQQVLINLVVNGIQAMNETGTLTIRTSRGKDGRVETAVQDTGHGIAPENMSKLFTPFFTTKEPGQGVGLGLAVSYGIIERHGGKIDVQSEQGKGTTFTVHLPTAQIAKEVSGR